ncbi:polysaccharide deacetylase family protein [Raineyella sp. W15-4]|uniref:polysaccharide deacetylase family protein n=1 Tax=Raineyella sp. W15-4 TaxID=3081651 RepID=UPI002954A09F|nr:polysaccharide deacetylase family protein [Raineyella sp. W15-4]WOQ18958.1 polysaccharide deacetylase family protein [Raineyella sp. W15-4]
MAVAGAVVAACAPAQGQQTREATAPVPTAVVTPAPTDLRPGTNHSYAADTYAYPAADVHSWLVDGAKAATYPEAKIAFLTFDDGPSTTTTPKDLDILRSEGVPATFFYITGDRVLGKVDPAIPRRALAEGHAICVHSRSHDYHELYPGRRADAEHIVADHDRAIADLRRVFGDGYSAGCYRYPGGHMSWHGMEPADAALASEGVHWIDWNTMTGDAEPPKRAPHTADQAARMVPAGLTAAGDPRVAVVLMHDAEGMTLSTEALRTVIDGLRDKGYRFGVIS